MPATDTRAQTSLIGLFPQLMIVISRFMLNLRQFGAADSQPSEDAGPLPSAVVFKAPSGDFLGNISELLQHGMGMGAQEDCDEREQVAEESDPYREPIENGSEEKNERAKS